MAGIIDVDGQNIWQGWMILEYLSNYFLVKPDQSMALRNDGEI